MRRRSPPIFSPNIGEETLMPANPDIEHFARLIDTLHPWLDQVVIIAACTRWHSHLIMNHWGPLIPTLLFQPSCPGCKRHPAAPPRQWFSRREELMGEMHPPVAHYHVVTEDSGFYAEFLTPLIGSEVKRGGKHDATTEIAGVSVQKLRRLMGQPIYNDQEPS
jgi:hypothetical protein